MAPLAEFPSPATFIHSHVSHFLAFLAREEEDSDCTGACLVKWKIVFAALLLLEGLVFCHVVFFLKRVTKSSRGTFSKLFHLGNALSAGVFFATGMLHVLPEAIELFEGGHGHGEGEEEHSEDEEDHEEGEEEEEGSTFPWPYFILMMSFYVFFGLERILVPRLVGSEGHTHGIDKAHNEGATNIQDENGDLEKPVDEDEQELDLTMVKAPFASKECLVRFLAILGISAHSLFESMALGLSGNFTTVLNIFIATIAHRWATSAAIAFTLIKLSYFPFIVLVLTFSGFVPLGIGIGAALGSLSTTAQGVLFSISAGTFIYIGVFEGMADEFVSHSRWPFRKYVSTLAGAGIITAITAVLQALDVHG